MLRGVANHKNNRITNALAVMNSNISTWMTVACHSCRDSQGWRACENTDPLGKNVRNAINVQKYQPGVAGALVGELSGAFRGLSIRSSHYQRAGRHVIPADDGRLPPLP
jgi:hypothetical protein